MEEKQLNTKEAIKQLAVRRKELIEQGKVERKMAKEITQKGRFDRDLKLVETRIALDQVMKQIYAYNKLGKEMKSKSDILQKIENIASGRVMN